MNERLYRSRHDRIIAGVAGGLAEQLNVDPSLVRIIWVLLLFPTAGLAVLLYVVMAFVVPEEPVGGPTISTGGPMPPAPMSGLPPTSGSAPMGGPPPMSGPPAMSGLAPLAAPGGPDTSSASMSSAAPTAGEPAGGGIGAAPVAGSDWRRADRDARRAERRAWRQEHRDGFGALLFGLILILVGGYYLVRAWIPAIDVDRTWPVLLVIIGIALLFGSIRRSSNPSG